MPSEYELSVDPPGEGEEAVAVRTFDLAGEAVSLILAKDWRLTEEKFLKAHFVIPEPVGAKLTVSLETYENPAAIIANDLERYLSLPELPPLGSLLAEELGDGSGAPDFEQLTLRLGGTVSGSDAAGPPDALRSWRKLGLLRPNHIRVLFVELRSPASAAGSAAQDLGDMIDHLLEFARFADRETAADRIAPSEQLKLTTLWDTIYLRVPADWPRGERENPDGTGRYVFADRQADRWSFYADFDVYHSPRTEDAEAFTRGLAKKLESEDSEGFRADTFVDPMPDRPGEAMLTATSQFVENGDTLRHTAWRRVVCRDNSIIIGHFDWVMLQSVCEQPEMKALSTLVAREVRNAVLVQAWPSRLRGGAGPRP